MPLGACNTRKFTHDTGKSRILFFLVCQIQTPNVNLQSEEHVWWQLTQFPSLSVPPVPFHACYHRIAFCRESDDPTGDQSTLEKENSLQSCNCTGTAHSRNNWLAVPERRNTTFTGLGRITAAP